jgi:hypothetical protein
MHHSGANEAKLSNSVDGLLPFLWPCQLQHPIYRCSKGVHTRRCNITMSFLRFLRTSVENSSKLCQAIREFLNAATHNKLNAPGTAGLSILCTALGMDFHPRRLPVVCPLQRGCHYILGHAILSSVHTTPFIAPSIKKDPV